MNDEIRHMENKIRTCEDKLLRTKDIFKIDELQVELRRLRVILMKKKRESSI